VSMFTKIVSDKVLWFFVVVAVGFLWWIYSREGFSGLRNAFCDEIRIAAVKFTVICIVFILVVGSVDHLAKKNPETVKELISGKRGWLPMIAASVFIPGVGVSDQLREEWEEGSHRSNVIVCLAAMMLLSVTTFMFRASFLGSQLTLIWIVIGLVILILIWLITRLL
ncbi:MAG: hypothetical protein ACHQVK_02815, partial [Candidatus Paceibacterales bacterium]